jgi:hypothetical protein
VFEAAARLGVRVAERDLGPSLFGMTRGPRAVVVSSRLSAPERRFTLAHELAHILVKRGAAPWVQATWEERFADAFSRELLIPSTFLAKYGPNDAERLSRRLQAPLVAVLLQFASVGMLPALSCTADGGVLCVRCGDRSYVPGCTCSYYRQLGGAGLPMVGPRRVRRIA